MRLPHRTRAGAALNTARLGSHGSVLQPESVELFVTGIRRERATRGGKRNESKLRKRKKGWAAGSRLCGETEYAKTRQKEKLTVSVGRGIHEISVDNLKQESAKEKKAFRKRGNALPQSEQKNHIGKHMQVHTHTHLYTYTPAQMHTADTRVYTHTHTHTVDTQTHTYTYMHTHTAHTRTTYTAASLKRTEGSRERVVEGERTEMFLSALRS